MPWALGSHLSGQMIPIGQSDLSGQAKGYHLKAHTHWMIFTGLALESANSTISRLSLINTFNILNLLESAEGSQLTF